MKYVKTTVNRVCDLFHLRRFSCCLYSAWTNGFRKRCW